jgi:hypothetical protein
LQDRISALSSSTSVLTMLTTTLQQTRSFCLWSWNLRYLHSVLLLTTILGWGDDFIWCPPQSGNTQLMNILYRHQLQKERSIRPHHQFAYSLNHRLEGRMSTYDVLLILLADLSILLRIS